MNCVVYFEKDGKKYKKNVDADDDISAINQVLECVQIHDVKWIYEDKPTETGDTVDMLKTMFGMFEK